MSQIMPVPNPTKSYWLSEPHEHSNLRSTPELPSECDITVIGSGMAGIATAGLEQIVKEEDLDCEFELRRSFDVFLDAHEAKALRDNYEKSKEAGEIWTKDFSWVPAQHVDSQLNVQTTTPVTSVSISPDGQNVLTTPRGVTRAKKVVFATNAYTAGLLPQFKDTIISVRGTASHITPSTPVHPHLSHTYNLNFSPATGIDYLNPRPDSTIVVGGGGWLFKSDRASWYNNFDDSTQFAGAIETYWVDYMQLNFCGWEDSGTEVEKVWTGIMGFTPDGWAHVGRVPGREG
ncbi:hypothetical protein K458DRAFT_489612 [Lentithecium fluviatile CBS 122367]|uniref:FAD dependent oxidoreductase domain-containing protein n=1 Tax=Lentithecium fluviatile CBS 122367 TaxID=1168545 RepID=A0A6G1ISQ8_9PLEO|nr:hypothetical protein K458DRAFT_489612 [Lentithecium fluviatile CBS 122367]